MEWRRHIEEQDTNSKIPLFEGRPDRERFISDEDIMNLKILLNTESDFETLLSKL